MDWSKYPNFSEDEFRCSHTGKCEIEPAFMDKMQSLRTKYGKPMTITSGYRHETHPIEAKKERAGMHTKGIAADIACNGQEAYHIMKLAFRLRIYRHRCCTERSQPLYSFRHIHQAATRQYLELLRCYKRYCHYYSQLLIKPLI